MAFLKIPFTNLPQRFEIDLAGTSYVLANRWNPAPGGGWFVDVYDADEKPIAMNIPLVTGANIFEAFAHLGLPQAVVVFTDGDNDAGIEATLDSLGVETNVYLVN